MQTSIDFLRAIQSRHGLTSDGQLARKLGMTRAGISKLLSGQVFLSDESVLKVAELLEMDPGEIALAVHFERAKTAPEKAMWQHIIQRLGGVAAGVLLALTLLSSPPDYAAEEGAIMTVASLSNTHYANYAVTPSGILLVFQSGIPLISIASVFFYGFHSRRSARRQ